MMFGANGLLWATAATVPCTMFPESFGLRFPYRLLPTWCLWADVQSLLVNGALRAFLCTARTGSCAELIGL